MTVTLDVNQDLERRLRQVAAERGMATEELLQQVLSEALEKMLPAPSTNSPRVAGLNAGQIWIGDDFDAPLPDSFWTGETTDPADETTCR